MNQAKNFVKNTTPNSRNIAVSLVILVFLLLPITFIQAQQFRLGIPNFAGFPDPTGVLRNFADSGYIDLTGPFFQSIGTNGRSCGTCHQPSDAMSVSAAHIEARFELTQGLDPIFRTND